MATRSRKRRSCKYGKLKRHVKTKKGGKRRCKKSRRRRRRKSYKMQNNPSTSLEDMPPEIQQNYIFSRLDNFDLDNLSRVPGNIRENAYSLLRERPVELVDPRMPNEMLLHIFKNSSLDELVNLYNTNYRLRGIAVHIVRRRLDNDKKNELLFFASRNGNTEQAQLSIDVGANMNKEDDYGYTPLMNAVSRGHTEIVRLLIERGANVYSRNKNGVTAYTLARKYRRRPIIRLLTEYTALIKASINDDISKVRSLIESGHNLNIRDERGQTALIKASVYGHTDIARMLIEAGADVNIRDTHGQTAFQYASNNGNRHIVRILRKERE